MPATKAKGNLLELLRKWFKRPRFLEVLPDLEPPATAHQLVAEREDLDHRRNLLEAIASHLPLGSTIREPERLAVVLAAGWVAALDERWGDAKVDHLDDIDPELLKHVQAYLNREPSFAFAIRLSKTRLVQESILLQVPEPHNPFTSLKMAVNTAWSEENDPSGWFCPAFVELSGSVIAPTGPFAVQIIEDQARTIIGAGLALGIVEPPNAGPPLTFDRGVGNPQLKLDGQTIHVDPALTRVITRSELKRPDAPDQLEGREGALHRRLRYLNALLQGTSEAKERLRRATRFLCDAVYAKGSAPAVATAFFAIETALMDPAEKKETTGRLIEAVTYRVGVSVEFRREIRELVGALYDERSGFVHRGLDGSAVRGEAIRLAAWVLRRELMEPL